MANHLFALEEDFVSFSSVTAATEATGREAENVLTWSRPNRRFIGTGATASETLVFDMGTTTTLAALFVDNLNTQGVTVQGNATDVWTSPSYSANFSANAAPLWGRQRVFCDLAGSTFASVGYRYLRIKANGSAFDGASVWKVGGVVGTSLTYTIDTNVGFPFDVEMFEPVDVQPRIGAPPEVSILGSKRFVLNLSQPTATESLDTHAKLLLDQGQGRHVLFYRNNSSLDEAWMMRRSSRNAYSEIGPRARALQNVIFEEVA